VIFKSATYWKPFIERARSEPKFRSGDAGLDVFRALDAAGVKLSDADKFEWGKQALSRGLSIEAEKVWAPLFKAGTYGGANDKAKDANNRSYATAQAEAKKDREGGLKQSETVAAASPSGIQYANLGEAYLGAGDYAKAIEMFQKSIAKSQMDAGTMDLIKLRMGIAQFRGNKKAEALKTWQSVKADNGAAWLARSWVAISK
jgi:tetratricopeptide (TPR) repeat protein